jgi:hypothetical protein
MKWAIAIRVMKSATAIRAMSPTIVIRAIRQENFHSENFSRVSNWLVVAMMVAVHRVMKSASAIRVMMPDNAISMMDAIRVMKLNVVRVTAVADTNSDNCSINRVVT